MLKIEDLGVIPYAPALALQENLQRKCIEAKLSGRESEEHLLMLEHTPVVTLGRHAKPENVLLSEQALQKRGIEMFQTLRGGDVTYHGPGQLVVYVIMDLQLHHLGVKKFVEILEETVIRTIAKFGLKGERVEGATGVWLEKETPRERKICAIGVKCNRFVSMHGLALNVNTDLTGFGVINPCGFTDKGVTSIAREVGKEVDMHKVKRQIAEEFQFLLE